MSRRTWVAGVAFILLCIGAGWGIGKAWPETGYPYGTTFYEDGSYVTPDGADGCLPDGLCQD